ncbi:MAG TPA: sirohydrochlorin chelatase [Chloroflexota bacterium]|nr:sirohydrochlorin chelatase [Chloroflexota bacterium]
MRADGSALMVIAHGSRDAAARTEFLEQVRALSRELEGALVRYAVLEFPGSHAPSIKNAVIALPPAVKRLVVLPFFLFDAGHVRRDIPAELAAARALSPGLEITILPQVGVDDGLLDVLSDRVRCAAGNALPHDEPWAVLVVGAGTSSEDANSELIRMARRVGDQLSAPIVEAAFVSLARPTIAEGMIRCVERGARHIITAHYFLNTGVLARRIEPQARAEAERLGVKLTIGEHFGAHQVLAKALARRVRNALVNDAQVSYGEQS